MRRRLHANLQPMACGRTATRRRPPPTGLAVVQATAPTRLRDRTVWARKPSSRPPTSNSNREAAHRAVLLELPLPMRRFRATLLRRLQEAGIAFRDLRTAESSLEEIFVGLLQDKAVAA